MSRGPVHYHLGQFPPKGLDWSQLIPLTGPAHSGRGRYDGMLSAIPNAHILLSPLTTQEAVLSSKIEGTRVTMGEVLEIQAGGQSEAITQPRRDDAEEVLNYRKAMQACVKARAILALYDRLKTPVVDLTHSQFAIWAVDFIFGISLAI